MSEIDELRKENERLQAVLDGDFKKSAELSLKRAEYPTADGSLRLDLQATIIPLIAEHLAQIFKMEGGENYLGIEFNHPELGPMMLNIQRRLGETPAAQNVRLKAELEQAREIITDFMPAALNGVMNEKPNAQDAYYDHRLARARAFLDKAGK